MIVLFARCAGILAVGARIYTAWNNHDERGNIAGTCIYRSLGPTTQFRGRLCVWQWLSRRPLSEHRESLHAAREGYRDRSDALLAGSHTAGSG